ncbi:MAG: FKBP-type peptidyl-prolyl cis-trans isomerase [Patescibacteria group bacterium]
MYLDLSNRSERTYTSQTIGIIIGTLVGLAVLIGIYFIFFKNNDMEIINNNNEQAIEFRDSLKTTEESSGNTGTNLPTNTATSQSDNLLIEIIKPGQGREAVTGDELAVHYTGWLTNGTKFDSSRDRGEPFVFSLGEGQVIKGWDQGLVGMKPGEQRKLIIPSNLAYGDQGVGNGAIPAKATLIFEIELLEIN